MRRHPNIRIAGPLAYWWILYWWVGLALLVVGAPHAWVEAYLLAFPGPEIVGVILNRIRDDDRARTYSEVLQWVAHWTPGSAILRSWDALVTTTVAVMAVHLFRVVANWGAPDAVRLAWHPDRTIEAAVLAVGLVGLLIYHLHNRRRWK